MLHKNNQAARGEFSAATGTETSQWVSRCNKVLFRRDWRNIRHGAFFVQKSASVTQSDCEFIYEYVSLSGAVPFTRVKAQQRAYAGF
jgi:hypothetical protein